MNRFYTLIFTIFFIIFAKSAFANNGNHPSCGVNKKCADGYYCTGANADSSSGVCVANALNVTICRFVEYVQKDIFSYIAIFASVFLGLYMFVGKVNPGMVAQIVLGIGILYGSQTILNNVLGSSKGACSIKAANSCLAQVIDADGSPGMTVYENIRNTTEQVDMSNQDCGLLGCVLVSCPTFKKEMAPASTGPQTYNCSTTNQRQNKFIKHALTDPNTGVISVTPDKACENFTIQCDIVKSSSTKNYFICENTCTKVKYAAKADSSLNIKNCKDLSLKNIQQ